jgi:hypothetical protein
MAGFIITSNGNINLVLNNRQYNIGVDHPNYGAIKKNLLNDKVLVNLVDIPKSINVATKGAVEIRGDEVLYKGEVVHNALTKIIVGLFKQGLPFKGFVNLLERIMKNPSNRARTEFYPFLEKEGIPITPEGMVLGYKVVDAGFWSKTAGKLKLLQGRTDAAGHIFNGVGETIECERGDVDDVADNTCSHGLHIGGVGYATPGGTFYSNGDKVVIVEFDPADVISIPSDYNATKLRACKYKVVAEYELTFTGTQYEVVDGKVVESVGNKTSWVGDCCNDCDCESEDDDYEDDGYPYDDDEDDEDDYAYDDDDDDDDALDATTGLKPDGTRYHCLRDAHGHFRKK